MRRRLLVLEFTLLCLLVPTIIIAWRLAPYMFLFLWGAAFFAIILYRKTQGTKGIAIWRWHAVNQANLIPILKRFAACTSMLIALMLIHTPSQLFSLPMERPELWVRIMLLYPILSAIPQEFIFCTYFFTRFASLFSRPALLVAMSTIVFSYAHVLYINWVAPILGLFAGFFFASTYVKTRSLALVSIEHALYGNMMFTLGLGTYFYGGLVK